MRFIVEESDAFRTAGVGNKLNFAGLEYIFFKKNTRICHSKLS